MAVTLIDSDVYNGSYVDTHTLTDIDCSGTDTYAVAMGINRNPTTEVTAWTIEGNTPTSIKDEIATNVAAIQSVGYLINNAATTIVSSTPTYKLQSMIGAGFAGVDQSTPVTGTPVSAQVYGAAISTSYTGTSGNMLIVMVSTQNDKTFTATNCTEITSVTNGDANLGSGFLGYVTATGSAQTLGATWTTDCVATLVIFELKAAGAPATVNSGFFGLM